MAALLAISLFYILGLTLIDISENSISSSSKFVLALGTLTIGYSLAINSLVRHLHDQINTYYRAQKIIHNIGRTSGSLVGISGLLGVLGWMLEKTMTYNNHSIIKTSIVFWLIGTLLFGNWVISITRNLRFLNLISNWVKMIGYTFGIGLLLSSLVATSSQWYDVNLAFILWFLISTTSIGIIWFAGLYKCLTG